MADSPKTRVRLVVHAKAADDPRLADAAEAVRAEGAEIDIRQTRAPGDAAELAAEAVRDASDGRLDALVAGGGDGTLNEAVAGALGAGPDPACAFGLLPLGTANDFATGIGLPTEDLAAALRIAVFGPERRIDVGLANGRVFVNMLTAGHGARLTAETDDALKRAFGGAAYFLSGIAHASELSPSAGRFETEDGDWEGEFIAMAVGNGRQAGGGVALCPDATIDDGLLDVTILPAPAAGDIAELLERLVERGLAALDDWPVRMRVRRLRMTSAEPVAVNLDGEPAEHSELDVGIRPAAIRFRMPDGG